MAQKYTYDFNNRLLIVNSGITDIDVQVDLYSDWKEDFENGTFNPGVAIPLSTVGGEDLGGGKSIAPKFFIRNDWKVRPFEGDHALILTGDLFDDPPGAGIVVPVLGDFTVNVVIERSVDALALATAGGTDWTTGEKQEIRQALGITGTKSSTSGGNVDTLLSRLTAQRSLNLDEITTARMEQLDSGIIGSIPLELDLIIGKIDEILDNRLTTSRATNLDNLDATISSRAQPGDSMDVLSGTMGLIATTLLNWNLAVGPDSGSAALRTVRQALRVLRNRFTGTGGPRLTVYKEDDSTIDWEADVTTQAGNPIIEINPDD